MNIDPSIRKLLDNETTIHEAQIRALFQTLDRKFGLRGASVPIRFGYDEAVLGSYTPASAHEKESFYFSLLFIGYAVKKPLSKEDRLDLYKHEYAIQHENTGAVQLAGREARERLEILLFSCGRRAYSLLQNRRKPSEAQL